MPDVVDLAQAYEEADRTVALRSARRPRPPATSDTCVDCGEEIPAARRDAAEWADTCIDCQTLRERGAR